MDKPTATMPDVDGRSRRRLANAARLFDAAMALLSERAYEEITIDQICARAGVGRATFFRIFNNKSDLLLEFNRRLAERVQARLDAATKHTLEAELRLVGDEIVDTWTHTAPGATALAIDFSQASAGSALHAAHPELLQIVVSIIERGIAAGTLQSTLPARLVGSLALVQITAPVSYWFRHPDRDLHALIDSAIFHWLHGALSPEGRG